MVESLPVSEDIKKQAGDWRPHVESYRQSLRNLAAAGIEVVCYNFMPVLDWTRTDLAFRVAHGGTCMRFDLVDFAVFDLHVLERAGARARLSPEIARGGARAATPRWRRRGQRSSPRTVAFGLPGAAENLTLADLRAHLADYAAISAERLRAHLVAFLEAVVPVAEEVGVRLCCHPDDPPFPLMGLPRIMSTEADYAAVMRAVDSPANGITLLHRLARGTARQRPAGHAAPARGPGAFPAPAQREARERGVPGSFHEAEHLGGDTDMVAVIAAVLAEERRRRDAGRTDASIPFRPDHGQDILDDLKRRPAGLSGDRAAEGAGGAARRHDRAQPPAARPDGARGDAGGRHGHGQSPSRR